MPHLYRLLLDPAGVDLGRDKFDLADLTPAMLGRFAGAFLGHTAVAEVPLPGGPAAHLQWLGTPAGTATGEFAVGESAAFDLAFVAAGAAVPADWPAWAGPAAAAATPRPLLVVRQVAGMDWPDELAGADVLLAALYLQGLPAAGSV